MPSPCGTNSICKEQNGAGSCTCLPEYYGNPYEGCRPECVLNTDCASNKACSNYKCKNPCPGTCGQNAECQVVNHLPMCSCYQGYTGDPFRYCNPIPPPLRKRLIQTLLYTWLYDFIMLILIFFFYRNRNRTNKSLHSYSMWTK